MATECNSCKLFLMILAAKRSLNESLILSLRKDVEQAIGPIDRTSHSVLLTTPPAKYVEELGAPISSFVISLTQLFSPDALVDTKQISTRIERHFTCDGRRIFNLNPGYVDSTKVVVASGKKYYSRVHIRNGVYAEIELFYRNGTFRPFHYTFEEYRIPQRISLFNALRRHYIQQRRPQTEEYNMLQNRQLESLKLKSE